MTVTVLYGRERQPLPAGLADDIAIVPATALMFEIGDIALTDSVTIDGESLPTVPGPSDTTCYAHFGAVRSTGYHRLSVGSKVFWFGTVDAKLRLEGVLSIIDYIREEGLSWGKQLLFSDGTAIRDERVDFAWLHAHSEEMLALCGAIAMAPPSGYDTSPRVRRPTAPGMLTAATTRLLRTDPKRLLEPHERGLIQLDGKYWMPTKIVSRKRTFTHDTPPNRRATRLLLDARTLVERLDRSPQLPKARRQWIKNLSNDLRPLLDRFPFRLLHRRADRVPDQPLTEEMASQRSKRVFELQRSIRTELGWTPSTKVSDSYAYIGHSDEIFQAFVALVIARAMGAEKTMPHLLPDLRKPAFRSERFSIFYDTIPPRSRYSSWRDESTRPAKLTPDYCFINEERSTGLLGDAKYRLHKGAQELPQEVLLECQHYMQHFDQQSFVVFFPGRPNALERVRGRGNEILIASIVPNADLGDWAQDTLLPELERLMMPLDARRAPLTKVV